jgi:tetratricopeptide (TPR) repeat protein
MLALRVVLCSVVLCTVVLASGIARGAPEAPTITPDVQAAIRAYLQDPVANAKDFLDTPRAPADQLNPLHALLLGDAAVRVGQYRTASEFFGTVGDAGLTSAAELGMAWASLGRGRLADAYEHLSAANSDPALQQATAFAMAIVAAANGSQTGPALLAAAEAQGGLDPALREVAPLLDAYVSYWGGDPARAADSFTAFAVAHPDSRFADDAFYAAAQAKLRAGREDEAIADLQALAGGQPSTGRLSSRLVALDGRALLREGMRRDRGRATRLFPRRLADLLDGDGVRLAQAALAGYRVREDPDASANAEAPARATARPPQPASHDVQAAPPPPGRTASTAHPDGTPPSQAPRVTPADVSRFPWTIVLALAAAFCVVGVWLLARGGRTGHAGSR